MFAHLAVDSVRADDARRAGQERATHTPAEILYAANVTDWDAIIAKLPLQQRATHQRSLVGVLHSYSFMLEKDDATGSVFSFFGPHPSMVLAWASTPAGVPAATTTAANLQRADADILFPPQDVARPAPAPGAAAAAAHRRPSAVRLPLDGIHYQLQHRVVTLAHATWVSRIRNEASASRASAHCVGESRQCAARAVAALADLPRVSDSE